MQRVTFEAFEPYVGSFENDGPRMTEEEMIKEIERANPTLVEIEIIDSYETD